MYCTLFIVIPGFVFLALGVFSSDVQFLRFSDCDINSGSHVAVVLQQTSPASGARAAANKERKFVQKLQRSQDAAAFASFDFFGVRYIQATPSVYFALSAPLNRCSTCESTVTPSPPPSASTYAAALRQRPPFRLCRP